MIRKVLNAELEILGARLILGELVDGVLYPMVMILPMVDIDKVIERQRRRVEQLLIVSERVDFHQPEDCLTVVTNGAERLLDREVG